MRLSTLESLQITGTVVQSFERRGQSIVNLSIDPLRIDLEIDPAFEAHLGDRVQLEATISITRIRPSVSDTEEG